MPISLGNGNVKQSVILNSPLCPSDEIGESYLRIDDFLQLVDPSLHNRSGSIFYSGRRAFTQPSDIYILGLNPGGDQDLQAKDTIGHDIEAIRRQDRECWSAYQDEDWGGKPGTYGMQPRVLHLLKQIGRDPRLVPASNVMFIRTRRERDLRNEKADLLPLCWRFHKAVIQELGIQHILCFGRTAGLWVREMLSASELLDQFQETNRRRWASEAHLSADGRSVITLTHPSIAKWDAVETDPTGLVRSVVDRFRPSTP